MAVVLVVSMAIPCSAAPYEDYGLTSDILTNYESVKDKYPYSFVATSVDPEQPFIFYGFSNKPYISGSNVTFNKGDLGYCYATYDNGWSNIITFSNSTTIPINNIIYSSSDVIESGNVVIAHTKNFWRDVTLNEEIQDVVKDTITNDTVPYISNTFGVLVLVGVGILGVIILLVLLGKKKSIFRI